MLNLTYVYYRNDALYQAATTTTTTTTTVAPPPTQPTERPYRRPIRPVRPLRRRRPQIDYYYDEEELDDYYYDDEPVSRRKPLRTRNRRPIQDADDYDAPLPSRGGAYNYDDEDDYQPAGKRRPYDQQSRNRNRNSEKRRYNEDSRDDRRYYDSNKRHNADVDERRPLPANEDGPSERRRYRNRRPTVADDNVPSPRSRDRENPRPIQRDDRDDEAPYRSTYDNDSPREAAGPKIRPTGSGSSIFKAPRPPPKINRPVPANEKKKFEYIRPDKATEDDADYEVSFVKYKPARDEVVDDGEKVTGRRDQGVVHNSQTKTDEYEDEDLPPPPATSVINRNFKPSRRNPDPPIEEVKPRKSQSSRHQAPVRVREEEIEDVADYEEEETTPAAKKYNKYSSRSVLRKPAAARQPDDFEASAPGHTAPASRHNTNDEYDTVRNQRDSPKGYAPRNPPIIMQRLSQRESQRQAAVAAANIEKEVEAAESRKTIDKSSQLPANEKSAAKDEKDFSTPRTVKRPFLPSRGGSPYLPRGLKPVGAAQNISTEPPSTTAEPTDAIPEIVTEPMLPVMSPAPPPTSTQKIDVPIFDNDPTSGPSAPYDDYSEEVQESPKQTLEKIYNSEYDAALNDALNPTLKPLTLSSVSPIGFSLSNKFDRSRGSIYHQPSAYDSISRSSSQLYKTFLQQPSSQLAAKSVPYQSQQSQLPFYDDYEY